MPAATQDRAVQTFDADARTREIVGLVSNRRDQLMSLLGGDERLHDRFVTVALDAVVKNRDVLEADPLSVIGAIRDAAMMGLEPAGQLGDGAIVAYRDNSRGGMKVAQFQPMYRGLMKLARRSGDVVQIDAAIRYAKDHFVYRRGTDPVIEHEPWVDDDDPGDILGAYAFAKFRTGELQIVYYPLAKLLHIRDTASRQYATAVKYGKTDSLWHRWPEAMMLKTVIRALMKMLPLDPFATRALAYDDTADAVRPEDAGTVTATRPGRVPRLAARLAGDPGAPGRPDENGDDADVDTATPEGDAHGPSTGVTEAPGVTATATATGEVIHGDAVCGATSDPKLGDVMTCTLTEGHKGPHTADDGSKWPNR